MNVETLPDWLRIPSLEILVCLATDCTDCCSAYLPAGPHRHSYDADKIIILLV